MSFAERFKKLRGLETQKAFAEKLGITPQAILNYEKYGRIPKGRYLANICQRLGVREEWLLTGEGPMHSEAAENQNETCRTTEGHPSGQPADIVEKRYSPAQKMSDMSEKSGAQEPSDPYLKAAVALQERLLAAQERLLALTEQNAELRLRITARDARIQELTQENRALKEALRGTAPVPDSCARTAG